ncbi:hypothetical protein VPNG_07461 [Cytospora leucostoma]|uniref:Serine/threonine-protein kinase ppk6 n=1 Tax=Cytospora leucostoma TaxID=1230097 RepID=A0A423WMK1_9PEZI|nr:hypothetical protein VPNG_07461 [Cytospora leucostoma]
MSADLFAEFGAFNSGTSQQPKQTSQAQSKPTLATNNDPFSFLASPATYTSSPQVFGGPSPSVWPSIGNKKSGGNDLGYFGTFGAAVNTPQKPLQESVDDDDAWGDFEEAPPSATVAQPPPRPLQSKNLPLARTGLATAAKPPIMRVDTMDLMSNRLVGVTGSKKEPEPWQARPSWGAATSNPSNLWSSSQPSETKPKPQPQTAKANADVLFDADDFDGEAPDDDDDFGDFETAETKAAPKEKIPVQPALADLLSLDFGAPASQTAPATLAVPTGMSGRKGPPTQLLSNLDLSASPHSPSTLYPHAPKSPAFSDRNPFPGLAVTTPVSGTYPQEVKDDKGKPLTAWPEAESATDKDDWDAFADFPPDEASITPGDPSAVDSSWDWNAVDAPQPSRKSPISKPITQHKVSAPETTGPPPTNIPPPSILLSIFPELLEEAETKLYKPTARQPQAVKDRIYSDPATLSYLKGYLILAAVAARILAGRKHRWHRDKFLAQGMSISAAGSKGGMKLAGVDKAQAAREDREATDVVGVWRDHVGKLKTAVAQANIGMQKQPVKMEPLRVPEINDHMAVTTAKVVPTAPKACVVCGLKREERVKGVDVEVEDSFGEWWIDHWGHRACRNFWFENEEKLRSR